MLRSVLTFLALALILLLVPTPSSAQTRPEAEGLPTVAPLQPTEMDEPMVEPKIVTQDLKDVIAGKPIVLRFAGLSVEGAAKSLTDDALTIDCNGETAVLPRGLLMLVAYEDGVPLLSYDIKAGDHISTTMSAFDATFKGVDGNVALFSTEKGDLRLPIAVIPDNHAWPKVPIASRVGVVDLVPFNAALLLHQAGKAQVFAQVADASDVRYVLRPDPTAGFDPIRVGNKYQVISTGVDELPYIEP